MKMGIIAAGKGERLTRGGIGTPKPLVRVGEKPLIARIIDAASRIDVSSIAIIVNDLDPTVAGYLRSMPLPVPLNLVVKTTPSSMESLFCLAPFLGDEAFVLFTVDVVFEHRTLEDFLRNAGSFTDAKGVLALTRFVDDEKPLWVAVDGGSRITAMGDAAKGSPFVTAGFYYFKPDIFKEIDAARRKNLNALRQFLGHLIDNGYPISGVEVAKTVDVDYPEDIEKAEAFLKEINEA